MGFMRDWYAETGDGNCFHHRRGNILLKKLSGCPWFAAHDSNNSGFLLILLLRNSWQMSQQHRNPTITGVGVVLRSWCSQIRFWSPSWLFGPEGSHSWTLTGKIECEVPGYKFLIKWADKVVGNDCPSRSLWKLYLLVVETVFVQNFLSDEHCHMGCTWNVVLY